MEEFSLFKKLPYELKLKIYFLTLKSPTSDIIKKFWKNNKLILWNQYETCHFCGKKILIKKFDNIKYNMCYWYFRLDGDSEMICSDCNKKTYPHLL